VDQFGGQNFPWQEISSLLIFAKYESHSLEAGWKSGWEGGKSGAEV